MARQEPRAGSLLVITLWLVTILSVLAIAVARYLSVEVRLTKHRLAIEQAKTLARSGVYVAMQRLDQDVKPGADGKVYDWLGDEWAAPPGADPAHPEAWVIEGMTIRITDEERRLDLNAVSEPVLAQLLQAVAPASADLARPILDDLDADDEGPMMGEPPYYPKNAPAAALEELVEIPRVAAAFTALQPFLAVAPGTTTPPAVNINTAGREVLLALGAEPATVEALLTARPGADQTWGTADDCKATEISQAAVELAACSLAGDTPKFVTLLSLPTAAFAVSSSRFRVRVDAAAGGREARRHVEAVVQRTADGSKILAWREG